jgi:hypothetical protein
MDDKLIESWYKRYLAEQVSPNIWRLHWQPTADGNGVELVLNGVGGQTRLHGDGPEALAKALLDLGGYLAQAIWSQETLATYLAGTILQPDKIPGTAKEMWAVSSPLLDYDTGAAPNVQAVAVLGANPTVRDTEPLLREFIPRLPNERQMRTLEITDPYAMLLARMIDVIPSDATTPHRDAEKVYRPTYGLSAETAGRGTYAPPRAVFPAERHALVYEQRLPEINQAPRLFHPMFVTALEDEKRAILFVKALAGGLMRAEYRDDTEVVVVDTPTGPYPLSAPEDRQYRRVSPVVLSMLRFVIAPERTLRGVEEMLQGIPDLEQRWRDFVKHELPEMSKSELGGEKDLAAFADLVLYDLLEGRTS